MKSRLRRAIDILVYVKDTPHHTALSFAIGVYIAFFPILGIHTVMAIAIAFYFRLGRGPMLIGTYINNPWTVAPLYMAGTLLGCALLGVSPEGLTRIDWSLEGWAFYRALIATLRYYVLPFVVGNTLLGTLSGTASYLGLRFLLERRAARQAVPHPDSAA